MKFPLKFYSRLNSKLRLLVGLLNCEGSLILTHSGSGLVRRKTVIGINIATSASRSIGKLRWLKQDKRERLSGAKETRGSGGTARVRL